jgi:hypothetical protein
MATLTQKQFDENLAQSVRRIEQQQFIGYWAKSKGINLKTIERHKHFDDVLLLLKYKEAFGNRFDKKSKCFFAGVWSMVYHKNKPLQPKHLDKMANIGLTITQKINRIKSLRQT